MGKHLKLNIKNTQLAEAFKIKKKPAVETAQQEPAPKAAEGEPKKKLSRLREDSTVTSALKQAEKTLAARDKDKKEEAQLGIADFIRAVGG